VLGEENRASAGMDGPVLGRNYGHGEGGRGSSQGWDGVTGESSLLQSATLYDYGDIWRVDVAVRDPG
jgi:hypothetical protein